MYLVISWAISNPKDWCCESAAFNMPANLENSAVATRLEKVSFHSNPKERQCLCHFHFSLACIGEGNGNPLQCSCLKNPRDGEPGGLLSMGSHKVGHDWNELAAAAAARTIWVDWLNFWDQTHLLYHLCQLFIVCLSLQGGKEGGPFLKSMQ